MGNLRGKKILITGASGGIGEKLAFKVAENQAEPILIARNKDKLELIARKMTEYYGVPVSYYALDITEQTKWRELAENFSMIDILINNAGVGYFERFETADWQHMEEMIQLNIKALMQTTYYLLPALKRGNPAHIVNIGSQAGKIATPKSSVYSATKAFVISFSNALRLELKTSNIYVTSVNIGPVKTNFFKQADPEGHYQESVSNYMLDADRVAAKIAKHLLTDKREINLPVWMNTGSKMYQLFPGLMETLLKNAFNKK